MWFQKLFFKKEFARLERIEEMLNRIFKTFRGMNKLEDKVNRLEHQIRGAETERNQLAARITTLERKRNKSKKRGGKNG